MIADLEKALGVPVYLLIGGILVGLIVLVGLVVFLRSRARQEMPERVENEAFLETVEEEIRIKKKPKEAEEEVSLDERQRLEAKIQQLTNMLNVERDKLKAKEAEFKQQSSEFIKVAALKDEVDYLQKRLGELENEKSSLETKHASELKTSEKKREEEINSLQKKHEDEVKAWENRLKEFMARVEEERNATRTEFDRQQREAHKKHTEEAEALRKEIEDLKAMHLAEKRKFEAEYERRLEDEKRRYEERMEEIKNRTKDAIQKAIREKDDLVEELREENDRFRKEVEKLKERIRLLEVEHL